MRRLPDSSLALDFTRSPDPAPVATIEDVERVVWVLNRADEFQRPGERPNNGWLTAREIASALEDDMTDRKIRKVASASVPQIVSYPGSPGYKLFSRCTVDEINHCINAFESQGKDMIKRAILYRTAYHKRQSVNTEISHERRTEN